jgi:hypothetical protein
MLMQVSPLVMFTTHYFKRESLSILKYLHSVELNPTVTTPQGDIAVLAKCRYAIKSKKRSISLLDSSKQFVRMENEGNELYDLTGCRK